MQDLSVKKMCRIVNYKRGSQKMNMDDLLLNFDTTTRSYLVQTILKVFLNQ